MHHLARGSLRGLRESNALANTRPRSLLRMRSPRGALRVARLDPSPLAEMRARTAELSAAATLGLAVAQHVAIRTIHGLCEAIERAERDGIPLARIREALEIAQALHTESTFLARLQTWPRGYQGDYETIEMLCNAEVTATDTITRALEWYAFNTPVAQQHRNKVQRQTALLMQTLAARVAPEILLIGCGGCRDLRAVGPSILEHRARFTLNDNDPDALQFALSHLPAGLDVACHPGNALRVVPRLTRSQGFDLVIAGGLFDYLPDSAATLLLRHGWRGLKPGGVFFLTNIDVVNPYRPWMERILNWNLLGRTATDMERLLIAAGIPRAAASFEHDLSGLTHLIELRRDG